MASIIEYIAIMVPVRPIPAEQCTTIGAGLTPEAFGVLLFLTLLKSLLRSS